jgi:hypothetical protein
MTDKSLMISSNNSRALTIFMDRSDLKLGTLIARRRPKMAEILDLAFWLCRVIAVLPCASHPSFGFEMKRTKP